MVDPDRDAGPDGESAADPDPQPPETTAEAPAVPSPTPPTPEASVPETDELDPSDADPELQAFFWKLVALFNLAILMLSLGAMLVVFRNDLDTGGALFAGGAIVFAYGVARYRQFRDE